MVGTALTAYTCNLTTHKKLVSPLM